MGDDIVLRIDEDALEDLLESEEAQDLLQELGDQTAEVAADRAPKRTGEGARSIHAEVLDDDEGLHADVSWDAEHFYMGFAELGTTHQAATPFLRAALDDTHL